MAGEQRGFSAGQIWLDDVVRDLAWRGDIRGLGLLLATNPG